MTTVELRGRIVDDLDTPVAGAWVALAPDYVTDPARRPQATTDGNGAFAFGVDVPTGTAQQSLAVDIDLEGFEGTRTWILPNADTAITIYPTTTIRRGSTIQLRLTTADYSCGFESYGCRRIVVEPAGEAVVVEITETKGDPAGLLDDQQFIPHSEFAPRVTVTDGELYLVGGPATVTLRASRSADPLLGRYSLTLTHGCSDVPDGVRTRTYTAHVDAATSGYVVTLSDAIFMMGGHCTMTASGLGCHQFLASRDGDRVRFDLINADEWHGGYINELFPPNGWLAVYGSAAGRFDGRGVTAEGNGGVWYCSKYQEGGCYESTSCESTSLRLSFVRR